MKANILARTYDLNEEKWLEVRKQGIGGSDIAAIAGLSPFRNALGVYIDKISSESIFNEEENEAMYWGRRLEPVVADEFSKRAVKKVRRVNAVLQNPEHPFMIGDLDRLIMDRDKGEGILECKCAGYHMVKKWKDGEIPEHVILQTQWYMGVTGLKYAWVAVLLAGQKFLYELIERDDELIGYLIEIGKAFWSMVESRTPPAVDGSDRCSELLQLLYSKSQPTEIILPDEAAPIITRYLQASITEKQVALMKDEAANQLKAMMGENELAVCGSMQLSWKPVTTKRLDTKLLKTENPCFYEQYSKESVSRRFLVKEIKGGDPA